MTRLLTKSQRAALAATAKESGLKVNVTLSTCTLTSIPPGDDNYPEVVNLANYHCDK